MPRISGFDRNQSVFFCLDNYISPDNPVRIIDAFVDSLNLENLDFITFKSSAPGQQPYSRFDLLKLHLYGYTNGIRSSRKLANECLRNLELIWLIGGITPSKSSISDFVKVNEIPLQINVLWDILIFFAEALKLLELKQLLFVLPMISNDWQIFPKLKILSKNWRISSSVFTTFLLIFPFFTKKSQTLF